MRTSTLWPPYLAKIDDGIAVRRSIGGGTAAHGFGEGAEEWAVGGQVGGNHADHGFEGRPESHSRGEWYGAVGGSDGEEGDEADYDANACNCA